MKDEYTKREVDMLIDGIKTHITDTITAPLQRIEAQTMKTNGRVTELEKENTALQPVKKIVYGGVSIILTSVLGSLIYLVIK